MTPAELLNAAIAVAQDGLAAGEMPIGAVIAVGDEIIAPAFTQDRARKRATRTCRLLAMIDADRYLGWRPGQIRCGWLRTTNRA